MKNKKIKIIFQNFYFENKKKTRMQNIKLSNNLVYNVNDLVNYIAENLDCNKTHIIDPNLWEEGIYSPLWKNQDEKEFILLHPGLEQEVKINYHNKLREERQKYLKEIMSNIDNINFLGFFGFCLINDKNIKNLNLFKKFYEKITKNNLFLMKNIKILDNDNLGLELMSFYIDMIIFLEEEGLPQKLVSCYKKIADNTFISVINKNNNQKIIIFKKNFYNTTNYNSNFIEKEFYQDYDKFIKLAKNL